MCTDEILGDAIQLLGRDTRLNVATHFSQCLRDQDVVFAKELNLLVSFQMYHLSVAKML